MYPPGCEARYSRDGAFSNDFLRMGSTQWPTAIGQRNGRVRARARRPEPMLMLERMTRCLKAWSVAEPCQTCSQTWAPPRRTWSAPRALTAGGIQPRVRVVGLIDCAREGIIKYGPFRLVRLAARQIMFATVYGAGCKGKQASSLKLAQTLHFGIGKRPINTLHPFRLSMPISFVCRINKRIDANLPGRWKWSGV
jgi:hypothetical protein